MSSSKKHRSIPYTSTAELKSFVIGDNTATIIAYIDEIFDAQTHTRKTGGNTFLLQKFLLNNDDGTTITCNLFDDDIKKFNKYMRRNAKILFECVRVSGKTQYTRGNAEFELTLRHNSKLTELGYFDATKKSCTKVSFDEISSVTGYIKVEGYLKNVFVSEKNNGERHLGVITDKTYKLDVMIHSASKIELVQGSKLKISGDLQKQGISYILVVKDFEKQLTVLDEPLCDLEDLLRGTKLIKNSDLNANGLGGTSN